MYVHKLKLVNDIKLDYCNLLIIGRFLNETRVKLEYRDVKKEFIFFVCHYCTGM